MITWLLMHVGAVGQWRMRAVCKIFRTLALKIGPVSVSDGPELIDRERELFKEFEEFSFCAVNASQKIKK